MKISDPKVQSEFFYDSFSEYGIVLVNYRLEPHIAADGNESARGGKWRQLRLART